MENSTTSPALKRCTKCRQWKSATTECFYRSKSRKDGLSPWCKDCQREQKGQVKHQPLIVDGKIRCSSGDDCKHPLGPTLPATSEFFSFEQGRLRGTCRLCRNAGRRHKYNSDPEYRARRVEMDRRKRSDPEKKARYRAAVKQKRAMHRDSINLSMRIRRATDEEWAERQRTKQRERYHSNEAFRTKAKQARKRWYAENKEVAREWNAQYRIKNRELLLEQKRQYFRSEQGRSKAKRWAQTNRTHRAVYDNNRTARLRNLPSTLTTDQYNQCLEWWNYSCAYCGAQRDFWNSLQADHFIPITSTDCPGTTADNILPSCKYCNTSKNRRRAEDWLIEKFGKRRARKILKRIQDYFDSLD